LRRYLGKRFYITKRTILQLSGKETYSSYRSKQKLPFHFFSHESILLRQLKDVDMVLQYDKIHNLKMAISNIDGIVIKPGETFSLWKLIGNPSKRNGYKKGMVLESGQVKSGYGGGLCQLGNLIYWMLLHTPLTVKERWRHSFDVFPDTNRTLPFGSGATISFNYIDLQFKNETDSDFQLNLWLSDTYLNGEFNSKKENRHQYEVFESDHLIHHAPWGGYTRHNRIKRKVSDKISGKEVKEELVTENHAIMMYEPLLSEPINP